MTYAVKVEHTKDNIETVNITLIPFKRGLKWLYKHVNCEWVEKVNADTFCYEFPQELAQKVDIWIDEEGKINGALPTFPVFDSEGQLVDVLHGNLVFIIGDDRTGQTHGLTKDEAHIVAGYAFSFLAMTTRFHIHTDIDELHMFQLKD